MNAQPEPNQVLGSFPQAEISTAQNDVPAGQPDAFTYAVRSAVSEIILDLKFRGYTSHSDANWTVEGNAWDIIVARNVEPLLYHPVAAEGEVAGLREALTEARDAVDFFDRVKAASQDEQIAVGRDHWNRMEAALRALAACAA